MLLKMLVSTTVWQSLANSIPYLISVAADWAIEIFYRAAEVEPPGGEGR